MKEQEIGREERLDAMIDDYRRRVAALEDLEDRLYVRERKLEEARIRAEDWNAEAEKLEKWSSRLAFAREVLTVIFLALAVFAALTGNRERLQAAKERLAMIQLVAEQNTRLESEFIPKPLTTVEKQEDDGGDGAR